jgi:hypothetical protein
MPDPWVVCAFLFVAGAALFLSPMPGWVRSLLALSYIYLGMIFLVTVFGWTNSDQRSLLIRVGLIVLSAVTTISVMTWRFAGCKIWRKPWK